jgi:hypothetical protein
MRKNPSLAVRSRTWRLAVGLVAAFIATLAATSAQASASAHRAGTGPWKTLDSSKTVQSTTPTVWLNSKNVATVLWLRQPGGNNFNYEAGTISATGKIAGGLTDVFAGAHWGSLSNEPTVLGDNGQPLVVFTGLLSTTGPYSLGCIYGARAGTSPWTLQTWSLSNNCVNPVGSAGEGKPGALAAAFPGGWVNGHGVLYRIGVSPTIPATGSDQHIPLTGGDTAYKTGVVADTAGNGHFYVAWAQTFSNSHDGYYVKDVTAGSAVRKAPQSGTNSITRLGQFADLAIANRNTQPGAYVAYCSNTSTCQVKLWRIGAATAMTVPSSANAGDVAISQGPAGRLWIAWYNENTNKVSVVRTNKAATKFGPVATFATPCFEHGLLGLSGGSYGRLDVAMQCVAKSTLRVEEYVTQTRVSLHVALNPSTVSNTHSHQVVVTVTDAGDAVAGATVKFGTHQATTNSNGKATLTIPQGTAVGKHKVTASAPNYRSASATLTVTH